MNLYPTSTQIQKRTKSQQFPVIQSIQLTLIFQVILKIEPHLRR